MAYLLFKDNRVDDWTLAGFQDYEQDNDEPGKIAMQHYTTFVPEMSDAKFIAIREGHAPREFSFPRKLEPDHTLAMTLKLSEAPDIRLSVRTQEGGPAVGARLVYLGPEPRGPFRPVSPADEDGMIEIRFPAWGRKAEYRIEHESGVSEVTAADWIPQGDDASVTKAIEATVVLR